MSNKNGQLDRAIFTLAFPRLPKSWCWATVGEVGHVRLGRQRSPKNRSKKYPTKYLRAANITWNGLNLSDVLEMEFKPTEIESYRLIAGDVVLSEASGSAGEVGKPAVWNGELADCCFQNTVIRFRPGAVLPQFAHVIFLHFARNRIFSQVAKGVGIHHLSADRFSQIPFPVPPLNEQRRIVAKIEELFSDLDAGVAALERAKAKLKRYRAAVLKAAVEGRLTAEWRSQHPDVEPAWKLLERMLKDRRRKWEEEQLRKFEEKGQQPPKNWKGKYEEPELVDESTLPALPEGSCWASLEVIADVVGGITKDKKREGQPGMVFVPYLRVANVQRGFIDLSETKEIAASADDVAALLLRKGDILFTEGGDRDKLGRGWVWEGQLEQCIHQNHIFRARLLTDHIQPRLVSHHGNTFGKEWFIKAGKQTTNLASINLGILRRFPVPIAPAQEQVAIISVVDEKLTQIDAAEYTITHALQRASRLRQSILKRAFEGKLVAQDAADEPASMLLARIQQKRHAETAKVDAVPIKPFRLPKEVFLRRASVVSYTVRRLAPHQSFGRTQLEKTVHLTQCHLGVDLGFHFQRYAAGPFDKDIYKLENIAKKKEWFTTKQRSKYGVTYHPGTKIDEMCKYAPGYLGTKQSQLDRLLDHIAGMNTDEAELFATAYAAWNDLLIDGRPADDNAIISEIHGWHPEKAKFTPKMIRSKLQWMKRNGYVPKGEGERTEVIAKETKLKSRRRQPKGKRK